MTHIFNEKTDKYLIIMSYDELELIIETIRGNVKDDEKEFLLNILVNMKCNK